MIFIYIKHELMLKRQNNAHLQNFEYLLENSHKSYCESRCVQSCGNDKINRSNQTEKKNIISPFLPSLKVTIFMLMSSEIVKKRRRRMRVYKTKQLTMTPSQKKKPISFVLFFVLFLLKHIICAWIAKVMDYKMHPNHYL